jgi:lipoyl-dependent peroxiredoxin
MKTSKASSQWKGSLKEGSGSINLPSVSTDLPYNFTSRFENGKETNPEELIGAAHSGCFSMFLALLLDEKGYKANSIDTTAKITIDKKDGGFVIVKSELSTIGNVPKIKEEEFQQLAKEAKEKCPISKSLSSSIEMTVDAKLTT